MYLIVISYGVLHDIPEICWLIIENWYDTKLESIHEIYPNALAMKNVLHIAGSYLFTFNLPW